MSFIQDIDRYRPENEQERNDQRQIIEYIRTHPFCLSRKDGVAHITVSVWTVNQTFTKTLMVYHKLYDSWSWIGGHADSNNDLKAVALQELCEETGIADAKLFSDEIFSMELLPVSGHFKDGRYLPSHLHLNITYLAVANETTPLTVNEHENTAVRWFSFEEALSASTEPWMVETVYKKLINKTVRITQ
ncbi:MAG: NUDIX domain-containing protein [Ruminococcaceae bacterium]|nr:NUDIX domain-containing protein [Oscillospiraceae bacterium]